MAPQLTLVYANPDRYADAPSEDWNGVLEVEVVRVWEDGDLDVWDPTTDETWTLCRAEVERGAIAVFAGLTRQEKVAYYARTGTWLP